MADRALVRNAADPKQVKQGKRRDESREEMFRLALAAVMSTADGRLVLADLLERAGLYQSVYRHSGSEMCFLEGRRNFGLELQAALVDASEEGYDRLERERRARHRQDDREAEAFHTQALTGGEDTNG